VKNISIDKFTGRVNYSKLQRDEQMPNLLAVQLDSFHEFLQSETKSDDREMKGHRGVFQTIFPIESTRGNLIMEYMSYKTGEPKYGIEECQERGLTYSVPLKVRLRLVVKEEAEGSEEEMMIRDIQEQEVYLGELPMITDKGTFLINGAERVIVSQLHRSPGVFFSDETHPNGRRLFRSRIIPYRGSWVEFTTDINNLLYVHIDRKRKQPATMLLRAWVSRPTRRSSSSSMMWKPSRFPRPAPRSSPPWKRASRAASWPPTSPSPTRKSPSPRPAISSTPSSASSC
jgi:DNA-directed RNA polymerase subunit beta